MKSNEMYQQLQDWLQNMHNKGTFRAYLNSKSFEAAWSPELVGEALREGIWKIEFYADIND